MGQLLNTVIWNGRDRRYPSCFHRVCAALGTVASNILNQAIEKSPGIAAQHLKGCFGKDVKIGWRQMKREIRMGACGLFQTLEIVPGEGGADLAGITRVEVHQ